LTTDSTIFSQENGPFSPDENNNLSPNPYSWNLYANMLYLESPAGYHFIISNTDYKQANCFEN
jgi:carboxypeptidase C (cathepsin A)